MYSNIFVEMSRSGCNGYQCDITTTQQIIASCSGAFLTSLVATPFDVVKVRLQAQQNTALASRSCYLFCDGLTDHLCVCATGSNQFGLSSTRSRFTGTFDAFVKIARNEGLPSFWKGLSPLLVMSVPLTVIYYTAYDKLKFMLGFRPDATNLAAVSAPMVAGCVARTLSVTVISPLELIRTKLQSRENYRYSELFPIIRNAVKQEGILSLWRGLSAMLLRDVPFSMVYWLGFEQFKVFLLRRMEYSLVVPFLAGSVSGAIAAALTTPLDVVKTHMQVELGETVATAGKTFSLGTGSMFQVMQKIVIQHGYKGLFAGFVPRCVKVAPACAIMITSYEMCKEYFVNYNRSRTTML